MNVSDRQKRVVLGIGLLAEMLTEGWEVGTQRVVRCIGGLPPDAQYVRGWVDESTLNIHLVFSHPSFPVVLWGETIPVLDVTLKTSPAREEVKKS
jgi:hypothetical protein